MSCSPGSWLWKADSSVGGTGQKISKSYQPDSRKYLLIGVYASLRSFRNRASLVFDSLARLEREAASLQANSTISHVSELEAQINAHFESLKAEVAKTRCELMLEVSKSKDGTPVERPDGTREAQIHRHASILKNAALTVESYAKEISESKRRLRVLESLAFRSMKSRYDNIDNSHDETLGWIFDGVTTNYLEWLRSGTGIYWINGLVRHRPRLNYGRSLSQHFLRQAVGNRHS